jgi:predicted lipid carrier protein YhbT
MVPDIVHSAAIVTVFNRIFAGALCDGELGFLQGRIMRVHVSDMRLTFRISLKQGKLVAVRDRRQPAALAITGTLHAFLLLAARREDTDTLFFQRRLFMEGDTELGLEVKNFLDGQDMESLWLPRQVSSMVQKALPLYERTFS